MKVIVGLGNPGRAYESTRHNVGFWVIDACAKKFDVEFKSDRKLQAHVGCAQVAGRKVYFLKPQTYMNLSGVSVRALVSRIEIDSTDILAVCDDLDLSLGSAKFKVSGSSAGHKGIASLIEHLGTSDFHRLRVGISRPVGLIDPAEFVLQKFKPAEKATLNSLMDLLVLGVETWIDRGVNPAMNIVNRKNTQSVKE